MLPCNQVLIQLQDISKSKLLLLIIIFKMILFVVCGELQPAMIGTSIHVLMVGVCHFTMSAMSEIVVGTTQMRVINAQVSKG